MILGRPVNLWNGLVVAAVSVTSIIAMQLYPDLDGEVIATVGAGITLFLGSVIALVSNQPPVVNEGARVNVVTPAGQADRTLIA